MNGAAASALSGPVWVGDYARTATVADVDPRHPRPLMPEGTVARWDTSSSQWTTSGHSWGSEYDRYALPAGATWTLLAPQNVPCPAGFTARPDRAAWGVTLPRDAVVDGFRATSRALLDGVEVRLLDVWGNAARVSTDERDSVGDWVELTRLTRVIVEQTRALTGQRGELTAAIPDRFMDWRLVLPRGFNGSAGNDVVALSMAPRTGWTPSFVGPVPASGQSFAVHDGVPFKASEFHDRDHVHPEPVTVLKADPFYPCPYGFGIDQNYSKWWMTEPIPTSRLDGTFSVGRVSAVWRGRDVEICHVAYAYAYVRDLEEEPRPNHRPTRQPGLAELDAMEGPVRLDELENIKFTVSVRNRRPDSPPWPFLEVWGLDPHLDAWAPVHLERGAWQPWPTRTVATTAPWARSSASAYA